VVAEAAVISVLIPSRTDAYLDALLRSMERSEFNSARWAIVADNGLSPEVRRDWEREGVLFLDYTKPFVFSRAINRCAAASTASHYLVLNDDTELVTPMWTRYLEHFIRAWDGRFGLVSLWVEGRNAFPGRRPGPIETVESMTTVCFVAALIPRLVWQQIGQMDERYVGYGHDDDDYCVRLWHAGYLVGVTGAVEVKHDKGPGQTTAARIFPGEEWERQYDLNAQLFREKWGIPGNGRKGLSMAVKHVGCRFEAWHRMP
jgi:GT2 family glycosyltransferase